MSNPGDLIAFITARLDEDEAVARRNIGKVPGGQHGLGDDEQYGPSYPDYQTYNDDETDAADVYINRFRPLRMLREIERKRAVLDLYASTVAAKDASATTAGESASRMYLDAERELTVLEPVARHHAAVWDGHPDYRPEWKP